MRRRPLLPLMRSRSSAASVSGAHQSCTVGASLTGGRRAVEALSSGEPRPLRAPAPKIASRYTPRATRCPPAAAYANQLSSSSPHKSRRHWRVQSRRRWHRASRPSHQCRPRAIPPTSLSRPPPPLRNRSWLLLSNTLLRFSLAADPLRPRPPQESRPRKTAIVATITEAVTTTTMFARRATRKPPKNRSLERNDAPFRFRASLCRLLW